MVTPKPSLNRSTLEPDGSKGAEAPLDPEKVMFDSGVRLLCGQGKSEGSARGILGKWRKAHGSAQVIEALGAAQRAGVVDFIPWIEARFRSREKSMFEAPIC